jgi:hypothetical protein
MREEDIDFRAMLERLLTVQRPRAASGTRRHPDRGRSVALLPEMAGSLSRRSSAKESVGRQAVNTDCSSRRSNSAPT